jgi:hypothetical protein
VTPLTLTQLAISATQSPYSPFLPIRGPLYFINCNFNQVQNHTESFTIREFGAGKLRKKSPTRKSNLKTPFSSKKKRESLHFLKKDFRRRKEETSPPQVDTFVYLDSRKNSREKFCNLRFVREPKFPRKINLLFCADFIRDLTLWPVTFNGEFWTGIWFFWTPNSAPSFPPSPPRTHLGAFDSGDYRNAFTSLSTFTINSNYAYPPDTENCEKIK